MPHDIEACELFLSCVLNDPAGIALFARRLDVDDFPLKQGLIWKAMLQCVLEDRAVPTMHELEFKLGNMQQGIDSALDVVEKDYLTSLPSLMKEKGVSSSKKAELFCERIIQARNRSLVSWLQGECEEAYSKKVLDFPKWWEENVLPHVMGKLQGGRGGMKKLTDFYDDLSPALEAWLAGQPYMVVPTGLRKLDKALAGGLLRQELHIIAGRPGMTKTLLALTMSKKQAEKGYKVGWASLEMPGMMLLLRLMCADAGYDWSVLRNGGYKNDRQRVEADLKKAQQKLSKLSIYVDDRMDVTTHDVHLQALQLSMTYGIDVMYVDFVQLLRDLAPDRMEHAARVFRNSKEIAKILNIAMVAISQTRKRIDASEDKLPIAADIPFSGDDVAGFILMPWDLYKYYSLGQITASVVPGITDMDGSMISCMDSDVIYYVLAKARYVEEQIIKLKYDRQLGRISDPGLAVAPEPEPLNMEAF